MNKGQLPINKFPASHERSDQRPLATERPSLSLAGVPGCRKKRPGFKNDFDLVTAFFKPSDPGGFAVTSNFLHDLLIYGGKNEGKS